MRTINGTAHPEKYISYFFYQVRSDWHGHYAAQLPAEWNQSAAL